MSETVSQKRPSDCQPSASASGQKSAEKTANPSPPAEDGYHSPGSVDELTAENVEAIIKLEETARAHRSAADRISSTIARFCGSMAFVWVHVIWFGGWIVCNTLPGLPHFDAFPFTFLTLVVSLEAIFLSTFILISQNMDTRLSERRNHLDLQINLLAEQENTKMLLLLTRIAEKLEIRCDDDPSISVLEQSTRPDHLAKQIEKADEKLDQKHRAGS